MAWTFSGPFTATGSGQTFDHTVGVGSDRILFVAVSIYHNSGAMVSGITYGGVPLTLVGVGAELGTQDYSRSELWYLLNPASGTAQVSITASGSSPYRVAEAMSRDGVHQSTPLGAAVTNSAGTSATLSSASDEEILSVVAKYNASAFAPDGATTERWDATGTIIRGAGGTTPGASSVTVTWTPSAGFGTGTMVAVPIKPSVSGSDAIGTTATDTITIAGQSATGAVSATASVVTDTIAVTGQSATAGGDTVVTTTTDILVITGQTVIGNADATEVGDTDTGTVVVTGQPVTANAEANVTGITLTGTVTFTGHPVGAGADVAATTATDEVVTTEQPVSALASVEASTSPHALTVVGFESLGEVEAIAFANTTPHLLAISGKVVTASTDTQASVAMQALVVVGHPVEIVSLMLTPPDLAYYVPYTRVRAAYAPQAPVRGDVIPQPVPVRARRTET